MSIASAKYKDIVASLPCATCGTKPVRLHHIREGQGASQRASDFLVVPLCPDCHTGPQGVHGDKTMLKIQKATELDLVANTINQVMRRLM